MYDKRRGERNRKEIAQLHPEWKEKRVELELLWNALPNDRQRDVYRAAANAYSTEPEQAVDNLLTTLSRSRGKYHGDAEVLYDVMMETITEKAEEAKNEYAPAWARNFRPFTTNGNAASAYKGYLYDMFKRDLTAEQQQEITDAMSQRDLSEIRGIHINSRYALFGAMARARVAGADDVERLPRPLNGEQMVHEVLEFLDQFPERIPGVGIG